MQVTVEIPDDMAPRLAVSGQEPARTTLEAVAIEGYRSGALTASQTRRLLGFETRYELDGFLKAHNVWEHSYSLEDLEQDRRTLQQFDAQGRLKA
jgi:predicted HTH domain antitoxin